MRRRISTGSTASQVFHVPLDEVTSLQRRNAKAVNFGIVYGISSFGLSQDLSITRKEAAAYIEKYFETYPGIKQFLDQSVADAKGKRLCHDTVWQKKTGSGAFFFELLCSVLSGSVWR